MNIRRFVVLVLGCVFVSQSAWSDTVCLPADCRGSGIEFSCNGMPMGVAMCSDESNERGDKVDSVSQVAGSYCWCKSTVTVGANWIFAGELGGECRDTCAVTCANMVSDFVTAGGAGFGKLAQGCPSGMLAVTNDNWDISESDCSISVARSLAACYTLSRADQACLLYAPTGTATTNKFSDDIGEFYFSTMCMI